VSEEAARGPATSAFLTERALRSIIARGRERTGETLVVWSGACREPFPQESHFTPKNPPIGSITASASTIYRLPKPLY
jgi:hypothetical protein